MANSKIGYQVKQSKKYIPKRLKPKRKYKSKPSINKI